jgi:nitrate/nitrite-specific signal transduction histidine kinase
LSPKIKLDLRTKLLLFIISISALSMLVSAFILYSLQRQQLIQNAESSTVVLSNILLENLHHAMQSNDWAMVDDIIQSAMAEGNFAAVRILTDEGVIGASSNPTEVGIRLDRSEPACRMCHETAVPATNKTILFAPNSDHRVLLNVNLIQNRTECQACHTSKNKVLGLLMIETPVTILNKQLSTSFWQIILLALATSAMLIGIILPTLKRYIVRPVEQLSKGVMEIGAGNLDYRVNVVHQDELGELAESFDNMRQQLKESRLEMEHRNRELSVMNEVGFQVNQSLDLQEVLDSALKTVTENLGAEVGLIFLHQAGSDRFVLCASRGASVALCQEIEHRRMQPSKDISSQVARTDQPFYAADLSIVSTFDGLFDDLHNRSYTNVPLRSKGKVIGTMGLISAAGKPLPESSLSVVEAVGNQIGMVVENAQLYRQLRYMAVLEERDRLAREMHDDLAQALGYLNIKASITNDLFTNGQIDQAQESLLELKRVAKFIYTDVRESIFNLRTAVSSLGFIPTLQDYLEEYRAHYGMDVQLLIGYDELIELLPEVASQLLRVLQEALTNVRKHAEANKVWVRYQQDSSLIIIQVEDDGKGFNPMQITEAGQQHIGLQVMQERMESIGGSIEVASQPGQGTRVILRLPLHIRKFEA